MARRPRWWHTLQSSKNEVRLAVDIYNRFGTERQLEAFIVHMSIGWLKLLQAYFESSDREIFIRDARGRRVRDPDDGGFKQRSLRDLSEEFFLNKDPRKANLAFFSGLRNQIEHRYERDIAALVAGRTQAYLLNYEETLVDLFGDGEALAAELRFPIFLSSITDDAVDSLKKIRARIPKGVIEWLQDFDTSTEAEITSDQRFDFKVYLIPHKGPKTDADAAITFVRDDQLTDDQRTVMDQVRTIIREKKIPVGGTDEFLPGQVVAQVEPRIGRSFTPHMHVQAWRYFGVRPPKGSPDPYKTKSEFCYLDETFGKYVYTPAWVEYLVRKLSDPTVYEAIASLKL